MILFWLGLSAGGVHLAGCVLWRRKRSNRVARGSVLFILFNDIILFNVSIIQCVQWHYCVYSNEVLLSAVCHIIGLLLCYCLFFSCIQLFIFWLLTDIVLCVFIACCVVLVVRCVVQVFHCCTITDYYGTIFRYLFGLFLFYVQSVFSILILMVLMTYDDDKWQ